MSIQTSSSSEKKPVKPISWLYDQVTGDEDARVCKDIPQSACRHQPRNFFAYLTANLFGKIADELASARLTLPWLLSALGAPASLAGFLVPIREAGVLLPQLFVAAYIRKIAIRKTVWLLGAALSAVAMLLMGIVALSLTGVQAGWAILILLIVYSLARGLCSVSAKDVLGKTVSKTRRGTLMGYSVAIASFCILLLGLYLQQRGGQLKTVDIFYLLLFAAALFWLLALAAFASIKEEPGSTEGGGNALSVAIQHLALLRTDTGFRRFVILRILLLSIALIPPFLVMLAQEYSAGNLGSLGWLIIANGIAGSVSAIVWGRMSDRSSKAVMVIGSLLAATVGGITFILAATQNSLLSIQFIHPLLFFLIIIAHGGVRLGRKVYLVDMANTENRSAYVAVSNTVIGLMMLVAGSVGVIADLFGTAYAILLLSLIALYAAFYASQLSNVSG